jgi:hypothetical protein
MSKYPRASCVSVLAYRIRNTGICIALALGMALRAVTVSRAACLALRCRLRCGVRAKMRGDSKGEWSPALRTHTLQRTYAVTG